MQRNPRYFSGKAPIEDAYEFNGCAYDSTAGAYYNYGTPAPPAFAAPVAGHEHHHDFPAPLNSIEFQPSETCPRNFVIFDQTYNKSRVMFHPSLVHKFGSPGFDVYAGNHVHEASKSAYRDNDEETEDIDALLSSEEGEDDDVVSTGRTPPGSSWAGNLSPEDTACSSRSRSKKQAPGGTGSGKREKMKKMVKTLKGIVPGGDRMDTPAVLDEAVKYLKSLKVEVKKLGMKHN